MVGQRCTCVRGRSWYPSAAARCTEWYAAAPRPAESQAEAVGWTRSNPARGPTDPTQNQSNTAIMSQHFKYKSKSKPPCHIISIVNFKGNEIISVNVKKIGLEMRRSPLFKTQRSQWNNQIGKAHPGRFGQFSIHFILKISLILKELGGGGGNLPPLMFHVMISQKFC